MISYRKDAKIWLTILLVFLTIYQAFGQVSDVSKEGEERMTMKDESMRYFASIPPTGDAKYKEANYAIWIPNSAKTIRAIIMHQHGCGEGAESSGETVTYDVHWQALARKWDCALMAVSYRPNDECQDWCLPENGSETAFLKAIDTFSEKTGHSELAHVPWVLWGHSGGATWAYRMFTRHNNRIAAVVLRSGPPIDPFINTDSLDTPIMFNLGVKEKEDRFAHIWVSSKEVYEARRGKGGYVTWAPDPKSSHDCRYSRLLVIPYLDLCLKQRLPGVGESALKPMDKSKAWLGDVNTYEIFPAEKYQGDTLSATWLPNEDIAHKWKEFVETGWVTDESPPSPPENLRALNTGATSVEIAWDAEADLESGIKTFSIYRNGEKMNYTGPPDGNGIPREYFQKPTYHDNIEKPYSIMKYVDDNVKPDTEYVYQVSTVNWSDLESPRSDPLKIRTGTGDSMSTQQNKSKSIDLQVLLEMSLESPLGQLRAVPVNLGEGYPQAILAAHSGDAEIDPYVGMFFFPKSTLKFTLFTVDGEILWQRDLGSSVIPGIWFTPFYPFDLDEDGVDEIWFVNNVDPEHPLNIQGLRLERINSRTGETMGQWRWPGKRHSQSLSQTFRQFILGGYAKGKPVLVTAQGTYGPMSLQGWNPDMTPRWEHNVAKPGASGSHMSAVVDINHDGIDEIMWGERCIEMDTGKQLFCADQDTWNGHSDIVQPVLDRSENRWYIHTCRESSGNQPPRIVCFDDKGQRVWSDLDHGHIDTGWAARIDENGKPVVMGARVGSKVRSAKGEFRTEVEVFTYKAFTGEKHPLSFDVYTTIPVDLNGDGIHELVKGYFEGDGTVLDSKGNTIGNVGGLCAMACKFMNLPGEQILSYSHDGTVRIWADKNAKDSEAALMRYSHPFYEVNKRLTGCGYNLFNLGGI